MASSTLHGVLTWPEMQKSLVPALFFAPKLANHAAPRRRIAGAAAIDSTLLTVVGQPKGPYWQGKALQPGHALLAFERLQKRGFFATNIGAGAVMNINVERPAVDIVLADELGRIGLGDRGLEAPALQNEFAANINVAGMCLHREAGEETPFDQNCGSLRMISRSLQVPGSDSSALTTR